LTWFGLAPFLLFATLFLLIPAAYLVVGSFTGLDGQPTLDNYRHLTDPLPLNAYVTSIEISLVTAVAGGIFGFLMAYAVISGGLPTFLRAGLFTFAGVASNFAGVPLALAFIFTLVQGGIALRATAEHSKRRTLSVSARRLKPIM
jgi:putative spermidine/putrescine transport system permease protein